jgi:hypothetical protein
MNMKASTVLIAWTPSLHTEKATAGLVKVGPFVKEGTIDWTKEYTHWVSAIDAQRRSLKGLEAVGALMLDFHTMVVRDGIDPLVAHDAFLGIDEYQSAISPDIPGAEQGN